MDEADKAIVERVIGTVDTGTREIPKVMARASGILARWTSTAPAKWCGPGSPSVTLQA